MWRFKKKLTENDYGFKSNNKAFRVTKIESQVRPETIEVIRNTWNRADSQIRDIPVELQILSQDGDSEKNYDSMAKGENMDGHIVIIDRLTEKPEWYEGVANHELGHSLWHQMSEQDRQNFRNAIDKYDHAPTRYVKKFLRSDEESDSRYMETYYDELHSELTAYALGNFPAHKIEDESLMKKMVTIWKQLHPTIKQISEEGIIKEFNFYEIEKYFSTFIREEEGDTWVTINGTHVLVGKNDTVATAFKRTTGQDLPPKSRIEPGKTGIPQMKVTTKPSATDAEKQTLTTKLDRYLNTNADKANKFTADNYAFDVKTQGDRAYVNYAGGYKKDPEKSSFFGNTVATIDHTSKVMLIHDDKLPSPQMGKLLSKSAEVHGLSVNHDKS